jgi:hypothetical protein
LSCPSAGSPRLAAAEKKEESTKILPVSVILAMTVGAFAAQAEMRLPDLKKQPSAQAVLDEHFAALNKCAWKRQMATQFL